MFEAFDVSLYGKSDVLPATVALMIGSLWTTFIPYQQSSKYGLRPVASILRAAVACLGLVIALELSGAGYQVFGAILGALTVGFALAPGFVVTPPTEPGVDPSAISRFITDMGNKVFDKFKAKVVIFVAGVVTSLLFGFNTALWCTLAFLSLLLVAKTGVAQTGNAGSLHRPRIWPVVLAVVATACLVYAGFAYEAITTNVIQFKLWDSIKYVVVVLGVFVGALI